MQRLLPCRKQIAYEKLWNADENCTEYLPHSKNKWRLGFWKRECNKDADVFTGFPLYYSMNIHRNVDFIDTKLGLEMRRLKHLEGQAFHVRLSPAHTGSEELELKHGQTLTVTHVRSGDTRSFFVHDFQRPSFENRMSQKHGIVTGTWIML